MFDTKAVLFLSLTLGIVLGCDPPTKGADKTKPETGTTAAKADAKTDKDDAKADKGGVDKAGDDSKSAPEPGASFELLKASCPGLPRGKHFVFNSAEEVDAKAKDLAGDTECDVEALKKVDFSKKTLIAALITGSGCGHEIQREIARSESELVVKLTYVEEGGCEPFVMVPNLLVIDKLADASKVRVERKKVIKSDVKESK